MIGDFGATESTLRLDWEIMDVLLTYYVLFAKETPMLTFFYMFILDDS